MKSPIDEKGPIDELKDIGNNLWEGPRQLVKIGWVIVFPLIPLVALVGLVIWAIR